MKTLYRAAAFGMALTAGCQKTAPPPSPAVAPPGEAWVSPDSIAKAELIIGEAQVHDLHLTVVTTGRITFDDLKVSHVFSPVTGRVVRIDAKLGQHVKKGDPLASIESPDAGQFSADLDKARSANLVAERDYHRQKSLYEAHAASQRDYEAAENNYLRTRAEFERTAQKSKMLFVGNSNDSNVSQGYVLRAPIDGEVIARTINPGTEVQGQYSGASAAPELFTVGALDTVWVYSDLFEMDVDRVRKGQEVTVEVVAYPGKKFLGTVDWVSDAIDPNTRTARVRCMLTNSDLKLKPEMFATVTIAGETTRVLAVPMRGVYHLGGKTVVFVQAGRAPEGLVRFERRDVVVDEKALGDFIAIREGLKAGEKVVTSGGILLTELTMGS